jgi:protein-S-isoprenylcysteine O-methyltransferase Ste14
VIIFNNVPLFSLFSILIIGCLGLSICFIAQKTMGAAWRVGIDKKAQTNLVDSGIFLYCRNPTYLGLFLV